MLLFCTTMCYTTTIKNLLKRDSHLTLYPLEHHQAKVNRFFTGNFQCFEGEYPSRQAIA
jgi:hypothetical protein